MSKSSSVNPSIIFFFILFLTIVGLVFYLDYKDKKRRKEINEFCKRNGMTYLDKIVTLPATAQKFSIVNIGAQRNISSVMTGTRNNIKFYIFEITSDQEKVISRANRNKHSITLSHTVCLLLNIKTKFPSFYLRDSNDKIPKTFQFLGMDMEAPNIYTMGIDILNPDKRYERKGGKNIELKDYPDFCSDFVLKGINEEEVYKYLTPEKINALIDNHQPGFLYEVNADCFMVSTPYVLNLDDRLKFFKKSMVIYNSLTSVSNNPA